MSTERDGVLVTNRDIYDLLQTHINDSRSRHEELAATLTAHTVEDERRFSRLSIKVYGVMVSLLAVCGGLLTGHLRVTA